MTNKEILEEYKGIRVSLGDGNPAPGKSPWYPGSGVEMKYFVEEKSGYPVLKLKVLDSGATFFGAADMESAEYRVEGEPPVDAETFDARRVVAREIKLSDDPPLTLDDTLILRKDNAIVHILEFSDEDCGNWICPPNR